MPVLWRAGYPTTSIDDLAKATEASRYAIYSAFEDKRSLLLACIDRYMREIVDPAFGPVETAMARLADIEAYFETQIAAAETQGLPALGCFLGNLAIDTAPTDGEVAHIVRAHYERLRAGFINALTNEAEGKSRPEIDSWAELLAALAQGLWSQSRTTTDAGELRRPVAALLTLIKGSLRR